ncbi:DUF4397 domain-containing protein [Paenibacillus sp. FSL W8-1187]|uniref:DUF4397 domain-containing protein n=1 Tax=Paenibacillus sp. FSL W8-1187 TaxID=2975339 RepID=UPI0030D765F4
MEMERHPVWTEWQKASLYRMLADYHRDSEPAAAGSYEGLYREAVQRLAGLVRLYGNPFGQPPLPGLGAAAQGWPPEAAFSGMSGGLPPYAAPAAAYPSGAYAAPADYPPYPAPAAYPPPDAYSAASAPPGSAWPSYASGASSPWPGYGGPLPTSPWQPLSGSGLPGLAPPLPGGYGPPLAQQPAIPEPYGWSLASGSGAAAGHPGWPGMQTPASSAGAAPSAAGWTAPPPAAAPASPAPQPAASAPDPPDAADDSGSSAEFAGPGIRPPAAESASTQALPRPSSYARLRLIHAAPGQPPLALQAGEAFAQAGYLSASSYADVPAGPLSVRLSPAASATPQQADDGDVFELSLEAGRSYTAAACPDPEGDGLRLLVFFDGKELRDDCVKLRLLHLARTGPVDLMVRDGGTLFRKVAPGSASSYITLAPSEPELELTEAGSLRLLHAAPPLPLPGATALTLLLAGEPPQLTAFEDG